MKEIGNWNWEEEEHYRLLLQRLATRPDPDDELVPERLHELTTWHDESSTGANKLLGPANTRRDIAAILSIVRGIRNAATHSEVADYRLHGIMVYLARVLFEAWAGAWTRDAVGEV